MSATVAMIQPMRLVGRFATNMAPTTAKAPKPALNSMPSTLAIGSASSNRPAARSRTYVVQMPAT